MNINHSTFPILDLPDEILFKILNKLSNTDALYSLTGVNQRLDRLVRENSYTKSIDLVKILSSKRRSSRKQSIIDRFCFDILPRIRSNVQNLTLDPLSIAHVLSVGYYPKLSQLVLINIQLKNLSHLFNRIYTHQISQHPQHPQ